MRILFSLTTFVATTEERVTTDITTFINIINDSSRSTAVLEMR